MDKEFRLKDAMIISLVSAVLAMVICASMDSVSWRRLFGIIAIAAWIVAGTSYVWLALHLGYVRSYIRRSGEPFQFWGTVVAWTAIWAIFFGAISLWVWSFWSGNA